MDQFRLKKCYKKLKPKEYINNVVTFLDSFYTFWLMIQALDTSFKTVCQIPMPLTFVSQQVKFFLISTMMNKFTLPIFDCSKQSLTRLIIYLPIHPSPKKSPFFIFYSLKMFYANIRDFKL